MALELPKETENMIDRFLNHTSHPTLPTTATESLLPPSMNENNGHQLVTSGDNTGNPHHVGLSDNITLPDGGLTTSSLPSLKCIGTRASLSCRDSRTTKIWSYNEQSTRNASRHRDANTSNSRLCYQYFLPLYFSLHVTCRNKYSNRFTSSRANKQKHGPPDFSFSRRPCKLFKTYTFKYLQTPWRCGRLHPEEFADHTLPRSKNSTSRKSKSRSSKFRQCLSNCRRLSKGHATATALASQAGHIYWRRNRHQILHLGNSVRRAYRLRADQRSAETVSLVPTLRRKREKSRWATPIYGKR